MTDAQMEAMQWAYNDLVRELQWTGWRDSDKHLAEIAQRHMTTMAQAIGNGDVWRLVHQN